MLYLFSMIPLNTTLYKIISMDKFSEKEVFVETEKVKILVDNLSISMPSTILNAVILIIVLWNLVPHETLLIWAFINIAFVILRYGMVNLFRRGVKQTKYRQWQFAIFSSFVIAGLLFSSCSLYFFQYIDFQYIIFIYFILGGMVAGSVGSYHNNLMMYFGYSATVFLLPTIVIFGFSTPVTTPMTIMGLIFYTISSISAKRLNRDLSDYLLLKYENMQLVEQTEKLNIELINKNETLKELSLVDPLTKLKNRRYLFENYIHEIEADVKNMVIEKSGNNKRSNKKNVGYSVLLIDIDYFKNVNDKYGHECGDMILEQFSLKLTEMVRKDDVVSRIGGEEFVIILKQITNDNAYDHAKKIRKNIESSAFNISLDREIKITCTIGLINYPFFNSSKEYLKFDQALFLADKALYYGKENGRNRSVNVISSYTEKNDEKIIYEILADLSSGINKKQIEFAIL
ncbi:MAG: diguanylate cyclase [Desulfobacterales bacterium]|nr:diguanylate cyclase [Desulfobacterales bacterium]MCP4162565.1 diguanylate cyclase [Deltaproteobacteria bacterium]